MLWKFLRGHRSERFPLLSACRFVEFDTSEICHMLGYRFGSFLLQVMLSTLQVFAFERYDVYCERVAYLHSIL